MHLGNEQLGIQPVTPSRPSRCRPRRTHALRGRIPAWNANC